MDINLKAISCSMKKHDLDCIPFLKLLFYDFIYLLVTNPCKTLNGHCKKFCFPKYISRGNVARLCGCPEGYKINTAVCIIECLVNVKC